MNRPSQPTRPTGLILAGGRSTRFGADKALHRIEGRAMIERVHDVVSDVASHVLISVAGADTQYKLPARHIVDRYPDSGPLAGLHAGLIEAETEWVLAVAVDLPFITSESLEKIIARREDDIDAVVARSSDRIQPLCGCYRTSVAGRLEKRLKAKRLAVMAFVEAIRTHEPVELPDSELRNLNRPEEAGSNSAYDEII